MTFRQWLYGRASISDALGDWAAALFVGRPVDWRGADVHSLRDRLEGLPQAEPHLGFLSDAEYEYNLEPNVARVARGT